MSVPKVNLRSVRAEDESFLREVFELTHAHGLEHLPDEMKPNLVDLQFRGQRRQYELDHPSSEDAIIELTGTAIGRLIVNKGPEWHLIEIAILPFYQKQGIGRFLVQKLQAECLLLGKDLRLNVAADNPARNLYSRLGFVESSSDAIYIEMIWRHHPAR